MERIAVIRHLNETDIDLLEQLIEKASADGAGLKYACMFVVNNDDDRLTDQKTLDLNITI